MARTAPTPKLIPLKDAPWVFAAQRLRSEWKRAQEAPSSSKTSEFNSASPELIKELASENPAEAVKIVAESVGDIIEGMKFRSAPEWAMQEFLLEKLRDGKLEAWGVESTPERKRELEMLPPHFFMDARISWNRNTVTSLGATYSAVQVRRRPSTTSRATTKKAFNVSDDTSSSIASAPTDQTFSETNSTPANFQGHALTQLADPETSEGPRQKPGPPSGAEVVIAAYQELLRSGALKDGMTITEIHRKLVRVLKPNTEAFPNGRGLAYASIARHLRPHLRGLSKFSS